MGTYALLMAFMAVLPACGHRESWNPPHPVTAYLDWRQYKQFSHSDPERISCLRYSGYAAEAVAWDSVLLGLVLLSGRGGDGGGGGSGDLPIIIPPVTTEITLSFCNDSGQVIDAHRVLRGSNTWTETFNDDYVHMYFDIDSPRLVKSHIFIKTLDLLKVPGPYLVNVADELQRTRLKSHPQLPLPTHG